MRTHKILFTLLLTLILFIPKARVDASEVVDMNYFKGVSYKEYLLMHQDAKLINDNRIECKAKDGILEGSARLVQDPIGEKSEQVIYTSEGDSISFLVNIKAAGFYNLFLEYMPADGNENDIERNILIDGEISFKEAQFVRFTRIWKDGREIIQDINGNDIRPTQCEVQEWRSVYIYDSAGYSNDPLKFYFDKGEHLITIEGVREPMYVAAVSVAVKEEEPLYKDLKNNYKQSGFKETSGINVKVQAENMYQKSDYTLYQTADRTSAISEPQDTAKIRLNMLSGEKFKLAGQWVSWKVNIPEDGIYNLALRYKQNILSGVYTSRSILIDGEIPFKEVKNVSFAYSRDWKHERVGNEEGAYDFYLTKGEHIISLNVTLGDMADSISSVNDCLSELNEIYRDILLITGAEADIYRDYNFDRLIPETIVNMQLQAEKLEAVSRYLEETVGTKGEQIVALDKLTYQLKRMHDNPSDIASNFKSFKDNIGNLADWVVKVSDQPLSIDYLEVVSKDVKLSKANAGFFKSIGFEVSCFVDSFFTDYSTLGLIVDSKDNVGEKKVEVWITSGRDQANIIRELINNSFTPQTGINVDLKLVSAGTLLPAVLSGEGPDVALGNPIGDPIQYAMRNACIDVSKFEDYEEIAKRFSPSALASYTFEDAVYAIPETQIFPVLFYRKDIFDELGLTVPNTWDDFYQTISVLQRNNMDVGFPQGMGGMQIFLYQNGGSLYKDNLTKTTFAEDSTLDAFQTMLDLFTTYKFPRDYNFATRFRTGQMPMAIQDYTEYNSLTAFAPEIKGLWGIAPIPGKMDEAGSINRAAACGGTNAMILSGTKCKDEAWEFLKWWTSTPTQTEFSQEIKSVLGKAAMHATANMEALGSMPWTKEEYLTLNEQWKFITGTPEVPGNYYVTRNIGFASVSGYVSGDAEELLDWVDETNNEITRKRTEFGLE